MTPAPGIKLCAIAAYRLFHSHAQALTFTDSTRWTVVYTVNRRSRLASVLRVAFEDATLTQCDFYRVLKRDAIRARPLLVHKENKQIYRFTHKIENETWN